MEIVYYLCIDHVRKRAMMHIGQCHYVKNHSTDPTKYTEWEKIEAFAAIIMTRYYPSHRLFTKVKQAEAYPVTFCKSCCPETHFIHLK